MEEIFYIILVWEESTAKYLFNTRTLVTDSSLAHRFKGLTAAKNYFNKSRFTAYHYQINTITPKDIPVDPNNIGAIVE